MDMDTFFTELYVLVDDWYKTVESTFDRHWTGRQLMSDSEIITVALAGQWRMGVPWQSERGVVRYLLAHGRGWFPTMLHISAFNRRVRHLWGAFILLQQELATWLTPEVCVYEVVDTVPLPAYSISQAIKEKGHWLWWSKKGHGGTQGGWYVGDALLVTTTPQGVITGWLICPSTADDRWCLQAFLSARLGAIDLIAPASRPKSGKEAILTAPVGPFMPQIAVGTSEAKTLLADQGFNGARWRQHWQNWETEVISVPPDNAPEASQWNAADRHWLASKRQIIETVFASLSAVFDLKQLRAHSRWGQLTRVAIMTAAHNVGLWFNKQLGRPLHALSTLIC